MTRALALIALALTVAAVARVRRDARRWEAEAEMAAPFLDNRNSATYWYNPATGVVVSAN